MGLIQYGLLERSTAVRASDGQGYDKLTDGWRRARIEAERMEEPCEYKGVEIYGAYVVTRDVQLRVGFGRVFLWTDE